jgi:hypothetical protein
MGFDSTEMRKAPANPAHPKGFIAARAAGGVGDGTQ